MKVKILSLKPTQISAGMREIGHRIEKLNKMGLGAQVAYLRERVVPVVIGPNKLMYMIDNHHLMRALWEMGTKHAEVKVIADLSHLKTKAFWKAMEKNGWVYPYDQYGNGPYNPAKFLPETIQGLADNPYRGIAWLAREAGAYNKVQVPFVEFKWADFLRKNMKSHPNTHSMTRVMNEAIKLCKSPAAKKLKLPGAK